VIIPARNEEANIERAVRSVASQAGVCEIIVIDDHSTDRTPVILKELAAEIPLLCTLRAGPLPPGWLGKNFAVATGAKGAMGEWLLFTDADTEHLPGSLAHLLRRAEAGGAGMLSISPGQCTPKWWERAVIPLVYVSLAKLFRFDEVNDSGSAAAAANGQYILVRREAYEKLGGHESVSGEVLEDVALACRFKQHHAGLLFLPGAAWARTRMYRTFGDMWQGWTKNLYLLYGRSLARMLKELLALWTSSVIPGVVFVACVLLLLAGAPKWYAVLALAALSLGAYGFGRYRRALRTLGFNPWLAAYLPVGALLLGLLLINSALAYRWSGGIRWKGRLYAVRG
jgi:cellulose synthase/poly-beta-1,6-N-acetylglucosamine synthase-like glycosyltransferase